MGKATVRVGLIVLSGAAMGLSYPPYGNTIFAWFSFVPILWITTEGDRRSAYLHAFLFYFSVVAVSFHWPAFHYRVDTALTSAVALFSLTTLLAVPFGLGAIWSRTRTRSGPTSGSRSGILWMTGALVVLMEWLLESGPVPMPWMAIGNSQSALPSAIRSAAWVGVDGISVLIVLTNVLIAQSLVGRRRSRIPALAGAVAVPAVLLLLWPPVTLPDNGTVRTIEIAVVQPDIQPARWSDVHDSTRTSTLLRMTDQALQWGDKAPELVIWPETALPIPAMDLDRFPIDTQIKRLHDWTTRRRTALLTGAVRRIPPVGNGQSRISRNTSRPLIPENIPPGQNQRSGYLNSAMLIRSDGSHEIRSKNILVPFAEYVPLSGYFPWLNALAVPAGGISGYLPGRDIPVVNNKGTVYGVLICFESVFPEQTRQLLAAGADALIVLTQDGWWNSDLQRYQHIAYGRLRAIESGRTLVQVSVDGLSSMILPDGRYVEPGPVEGAWSHRYSVPVFDMETWYQGMGHRVVTGLRIILVLLVSLSVLRSFRHLRSTDRPR